MVRSRSGKHDIERRVRAAYSLDHDRGFSDVHRSSSSVPAALRYHRREESGRAATAPAGYRSNQGSTARSRLMLPTKNIRVARSASPTRQIDQARHNLEQRNPHLTPKARAAEAGNVVDTEAPLTTCCENGLEDGSDAEDPPLICSPITAAADSPQQQQKTGFRQHPETPTSAFGTPKVMELMEDRDRAVHLCLQVRVGDLRTTGAVEALVPTVLSVRSPRSGA